MKIVYFLSSRYPYDTVIYSGVGPRYAQCFGWPTASIDSISETDCDIGIVDNRLLESDFAKIDAYLASPQRRFPIFFKLSDPDMPVYTEEMTRYIIGKRDIPGVHYISIYDIEGPMQAFVGGMKRSKVVRLPFPYDRGQEVERDLAERRRRIFLSGAQNRTLYPLRARLMRQLRFNPLLRLVISYLPHPGYPGLGKRRHDIMFERYVRHAAQFTHFFLCPSRYRVEFMKFVECAYAGSVPIGEPPRSLKEHVGHCFITYSGKQMKLLKAVMSDRQEMRDRASEYRTIMRSLRDPAKLNESLKEQISAAL